MSSVKALPATAQLTRSTLWSDQLRWAAIPYFRPLAVAVWLTLAGCAHPVRIPEPPSPVVIPQSTWRQIDRDLVAASQEATGETREYAQDLMQRWRGLIYQRTDAEFVPWFSGYWTRQWLTLKVSWYRLNAEGDQDAVVDRLSLYLQEQYQDRVLEPVARQISPDWIRAQSTQLYVRLLRDRIRGIPPRYGVPLDQFDRRLQAIPAIALPPRASLYQLVYAEPIDLQPAYLALIDRIHDIPGRAGSWSAADGISPVARRASESLTHDFATKSVAGAISMMVGRLAGMAISLGAVGFTSMQQQSLRPEMETQLRSNLHAAFDEKWRDLMSDRDTGVLAGVYQISATIEAALASSMPPPLRYEVPPPELVPITDEQPLQLQRNQGRDDTAPYQLW